MIFTQINVLAFAMTKLGALELHKPDVITSVRNLWVGTTAGALILLVPLALADLPHVDGKWFGLVVPDWLERRHKEVFAACVVVLALFTAPLGFAVLGGSDEDVFKCSFAGIWLGLIILTIFCFRSRVLGYFEKKWHNSSFQWPNFTFQWPKFPNWCRRRDHVQLP